MCPSRWASRRLWRQNRPFDYGSNQEPGRSRMRPEDVIADRRRPYTGAEYVQSLRDGREVYIDGERVADVATHPAFRNSIRSIALLYDALHDLKRRATLTCET